jgi:hypothetical protein
MNKNKRVTKYLVGGLLVVSIILYTLLQSSVKKIHFWNSFYETINVISKSLWDFISHPIFIIGLLIIIILGNYEGMITQIQVLSATVIF